MQHDHCFRTCETVWGNDAGKYCKPLVCNRQLKGCLTELPKDCHQWAEPPRPGTEGDTLEYLQGALNWFTTDAQPGSSRQTRPPAPEAFRPYIGNERVPRN